MSKKLFASAQGASIKWAVGLGVAAALSVGAAATGLIVTTGGSVSEQPRLTLEAIATVTPTSTPEIDLSYYEPREWPTPTPAAIPTPSKPKSLYNLNDAKRLLI